MARVGRLDQHTNAKVIANIYDLNDNNDLLLNFGVGLFHSGVQIGGQEYTFASGSGIFTHSPKEAGGARFRESVEIGTYTGSNSDIESILSSLRPVFQGKDYNVITKNCNHFAEEFLNRVVGRGLPGHVNRLADIGSVFACLIPPSMTGEAPVQDGETGDTRDSNGGGVYGGSARSHAAAAKSSAAKSTTPFEGPGHKLGGSSTQDFSANDLNVS